jgi:hypothetical protein
MDDLLAKAPGIKTVTAYHSALESMEDTSKRACSSKNPHRKAAETSQRMMLSNTVGIIAKRFYIASIEDVSEKLRFDANIASAGELKAHELFALANDVPIESVHHLPVFMVTNHGRHV